MYSGEELLLGYMLSDKFDFPCNLKTQTLNKRKIVFEATKLGNKSFKNFMITV